MLEFGQISHRKIRFSANFFHYNFSYFFCYLVLKIQIKNGKSDQNLYITTFLFIDGRKKGRKEGTKELRKKGRKGIRRKEGSKERREQGTKMARNEGIMEEGKKA